MNNLVKTETFVIENQNYKPKEGELFFHKIENDKRKYILSLRKKSKNDFLIVISEQKYPEEIVNEEENKKTKINKTHIIKVYNEVIDDFIDGLLKLKDKLEAMKQRNENE